MEELHEAARAYYKYGSDESKTMAMDFFRSMDENGDGIVSLIEFVEFLRQRGYYWISPNLFTELDRNGDGCLDFWEVLTMYYMVKTRCVCDGCNTILKGLYFTCVTCFDHDGNAYDICSKCYKQGTFSHQHNSFLDSYVLLRSRRRTFNGATNLNLAQPSIPNPQPLVVAPVAQPERIQGAFHALEMAFAIGSLASVGCTIM
ncbi:hypothetical protein Dsin_027258 [Dipteronia sinensis]|uniref:EF-hand domain-containing protein n=1 Tax=Dipteronia sinensis TaxID=43782 RepID=A0AAD9ZNM4_9ROSI|nr:hypothetical protein Dsin_027258 [Dipteronia sinensis]